MQRTVRISIVLLLMAFISSGLTFAQGKSKEYSKKQLQQMYVNFLKDEGYKPEVDDDGDVKFKREGRTYFILVQETDMEFFTIILPNIWEIESEEERAKVIVACDASNAKTKVTKVYSFKDNVWVTVELFIRQPEDFKGVFARAMNAIDSGAGNFVSKMRE
ncbi:MAG TPA: hypothetical protein PLE85_07430 [Bacteroidales bacterium]|nr:hypothetical protein [Bacteroidales bacterium]